jgi:hypothetical protein
MRNPEELYTWHRDVEFDTPPVLVHAFSGFVDAGTGVRIAADHILESCDQHLIATFDVDEVLDYRARRPRMSYVVDHFASVDIPQISLHEVIDPTGARFLLLVGPEPDYQWLRFIAAVQGIVDKFQVRLAVGLSAIPWPAPHTRPLGLTIHGSEPSLVAGFTSVIGEIEVPGHVGAMLELSLGEQGVPSMGVTAQVPHYLVQFEYPRGAQALLEGIAAVTGLSLSGAGLQEAADAADREVANQLDGNDEFGVIVTSLETQYDQLAAGHAMAAGLSELTPDGEMPTGDEIAAQVEEFLNGLREDDERKDA